MKKCSHIGEHIESFCNGETYIGSMQTFEAASAPDSWMTAASNLLYNQLKPVEHSRLYNT